MSKLSIQIPKNSSYTYLSICDQVDRGLAKLFVELRIHPDDFSNCPQGWVVLLALFQERGCSLVDPGRPAKGAIEIQELCELMRSIRHGTGKPYEDILQALKDGTPVVDQDPEQEMVSVNLVSGMKTTLTASLEREINKARLLLSAVKLNSTGYKRLRELLEKMSKAEARRSELLNYFEIEANQDPHPVDEEANRSLNRKRIEREREFKASSSKEDFKFTSHFFSNELKRAIENAPDRHLQIRIFVEEEILRARV